MRKRLGMRPSPAMAVGFVALLAALSGTAVALPGSNTVTSGDIVNGAVKTQDIRNSTVRGRDVRNNTLTGSDINEGRLGTVPRANAANTASTAGTANFAGVSGATNGMRLTRQGRLTYDAPDQLLLNLGAFTVSLRCDSVNGAFLVVRNVSAGNDSMTYQYMDGTNVRNIDFDQGEEESATQTTTGEDFDEGTMMVEGTSGRSLHLLGSTATPEGDDSWPDNVDCVGSAVVWSN